MSHVSAVDRLMKTIAKEFNGLSKQLQLIGRYVEQNRDHLALDRIQDVADECGVQPSAVVRFAKQFGFSGFSEMQEIFRERVSKQISPSRNYRTRIRSAIKAGQGQMTSAQIAQEFITGSIAGLEEMGRTIDRMPFDKAVELLHRTDAIWIVGSRRSFPVAAYLTYALQHTDKRIQWVSTLGGMQDGQLRGLRSGDVMLAISFSPYAEETLSIARQAAARGAKLIALTDSGMSPLAQEAAAVLLVQENVTFGFRALTGTISLAQSLFIALAYRLELDHKTALPKEPQP